MTERYGCDVHLSTDGPRPDSTLAALPRLINAPEKLAEGARFQVVVFEPNAYHHSLRRSLATAPAIGAIMRDGRTPIVCSANCLQPDKQNDHGWDQGLLFLNPWQVWLQPPAYLTQMLSRHYLPQCVRADLERITIST